MKKFSAIATVALAAALGLGSCNSDVVDGDDSVYGVAVNSFKLSANAKVLANLDSVFFSIDLVNAQIFNADSLPYGTPTNKLVPVITMYDNVSAVELTYSTERGDTTVNYLAGNSDSIDFSRGPVALRVVSWDGLAEMKYQVKVNVHQLKSDSLVWDRAARRPLPSALSAPTEQKTARGADRLYCLTRAGSQYSLQSTSNPYADEWAAEAASIPAGAIVKTFTAAGNTLHILVDDGLSAASYAHYASTDGGRTWTASGHRLTTVYGACNGRLLANRRSDAGEWHLVDVETGVLSVMPEGMPVSDVSNMIDYTTPFGASEQAVIIGGKGADGLPVQAAWSYDGIGNWARLNNNPIAWACSEMVLAPFVTFRISSSFNVKEYPTLLAFGGLAADGTLNRTLYKSMDYGMTWSEADTLLQLPAEVPSVYRAQVYVYNGELREDSRSAGVWEEMPLSRRIPANALFADAPVSRATRPITEWECPYIFMFGGIQSTGTLSPFIWRATFNRLTFKPIQ